MIRWKSLPSNHDAISHTSMRCNFKYTKGKSRTLIRQAFMQSANSRATSFNCPRPWDRTVFQNLQFPVKRPASTGTEATIQLDKSLQNMTFPCTHFQECLCRLMCYVVYLNCAYALHVQTCSGSIAGRSRLWGVYFLFGFITWCIPLFTIHRKGYRCCAN